MKINNLMLW